MKTQQQVITGVILVAAILAIAGCATSPVASDGEAVSGIGPAHVLKGEGMTGERVVWGGRIVAVQNLPDRTELVVASYPLDRGDRPRLREQAGVRFILVEKGFLEPVDYAPGRYITALGNIAGVEDRVTGEHIHAHPVLDAERLHLWPANPADWQSRTRFSIGVGVRL